MAGSSMLTPGQSEYRRAIIECIRLYRSLPALWDLKAREYRDRMKKKEAYDLMTAKFRELYAHADKELVKKKINILRTNYRKELKKVLATGQQPNLWYYHEFTFLNQIEEFAERLGTDIKQESDEQPKNYFPFNNSRPSTAPYHVYDEPRSLSVYESNSEVETEALGGCRSESSSLHGDTLLHDPAHPWDGQSREYRAVGFNVAAKLQKMDAEQQIYAELLINKVLARGLLGSLTNTTDVTKD